MRRVALIVALCGMFQVLTPAPALALLEKLDQLSGPGKWIGWHIDVRLLCFGDPRSSTDQQKQQPDDPLKVKSFGIESGCPIDDGGHKRQNSIGVEVRALKASDQERFARDVRFVSIAGSYTRSLITDPNWNFVDLGSAAGVYWFSSEEFEGFKGFVLEPVRIEFHIPPGTTKDLTRAIAQTIFNVRFSMVVFPHGFERNAFAGAGDRNPPLAAEWTKSIMWLVDVQPLARYFRK